MKTFNIEKELCRGGIKQLMKVSGVRKISVDNYFKNHLNEENYTGVHSIKYDIQAGYVNLYGYAECKRKNEDEPVRYRCGNVIEDVTPEMYENIHKVVRDIFSQAKDIDKEYRRNILVQMGR